MGEKTDLQKLPVRIKYYLLEWKDDNMDEYLQEYGSLRLNDLTIIQLRDLFIYATNKDSEFIFGKINWLKFNEHKLLFSEMAMKNCLCKFDNGEICHFEDEHPFANLTHFQKI